MASPQLAQQQSTAKNQINWANNRWSYLRYDLVTICNGDICAALILETIRQLTMDKQYAPISIRSMMKLIQGAASINKVQAAIKFLKQSGFIGVIEAKPPCSHQYEFRQDAVQSAISCIKNDVSDLDSLDFDTSKMIHEVAAYVSNSPYVEGCDISKMIHESDFDVSNLIHIKDISSLKGYAGDNSKDCANMVSSETPASIAMKNENTDKNIDLLTEVLRIYHKAPDKNKKKDFKKSVAALMKIYGDKLMPVIEDLGDSSLTAMENFCKSEFWLANGLSLYGFIKQASDFAVGTEEERNAARAATTQKRTYETKSESNPMPLAVYTMPIAGADSGRKAIRRKVEALDILQRTANAVFLETAHREIGHNVSEIGHDLIEKWHNIAVSEFKAKFGMNPRILTEPL